MTQNTPMYRAFNIARDIAAALCIADPTAAQAAVDKVAVYVSRGHGGKHKPKGRFLGKRYRQHRSKYEPHQNVREVKRREYQAARDEARQHERASRETLTVALTFRKNGGYEVCTICGEPIAPCEPRWRRSNTVGQAIAYEHISCPEEHLTARLPDEFTSISQAYLFD